MADALPEVLGANPSQFAERYHQYAHNWQLRPSDFFIRAVLPDVATTLPEPIAVPPERFEAFLHQMCTKLSRCRS